MKNPAADRRQGVMFGLAYGDALGRRTEFLKTHQLAKLGNPFHKRIGLNSPSMGIVTDDTQMSIAVAKAALTPGKPKPDVMAARYVDQFIGWWNDPASRDGQRAPGNTCMSAVAQLKADPAQWLLATIPWSRGNGANMRVAPLALRTDWTWDELAANAQLQAAITHGNPTALAASELTAVAVRMLLEGFAHPTEMLIDHLLAYAYDQRSRYHGDYLGHLWEADMLRPKPKVKQVKIAWWDDAEGLFDPAPAVRPARKAPASPQAFIERGWDRMIDALLGIYARDREKGQDPCQVAGEGWVAEEALAGALHTLLCFPGDPANALRRAAFTNGDSDSIGSITGALAGAAYGLKAFPSHWIPNLEYRHELEGLTAKLAAASRR